MLRREVFFVPAVKGVSVKVKGVDMEVFRLCVIQRSLKRLRAKVGTEAVSPKRCPLNQLAGFINGGLGGIIRWGALEIGIVVDEELE